MKYNFSGDNEMFLSMMEDAQVERLYKRLHKKLYPERGSGASYVDRQSLSDKHQKEQALFDMVSKEFHSREGLSSGEATQYLWDEVVEGLVKTGKES